MSTSPKTVPQEQEEKKRTVLVPFWIVNGENVALARMAKRPILIEIDELGVSLTGQVSDLSMTHASIVPDGCFFLCKNVYVEIAFRFEETRYTLAGEATPSTDKRSFRLEFDTVARRTLSTLGVKLGAAGLIEPSQEVPALPEAAEQDAPAAVESAPVNNLRRIRHDPPPGGIERRAHHRYEFEASTRLTLVQEGTRMECTMIELSLGGCRLYFSQPCELVCGTQVEVQFIGDGLPLRLAAAIANRSHEQLAGLKFVNVIPRMQERLAGLIAEIAASQSGAAGA